MTLFLKDEDSPLAADPAGVRLLGIDAANAPVILPASPFAGRNGFGTAKARLAAGKSVEILIWGDSTGNDAANPREWPFRFADRLAALYPGHGVSIATWDTGLNGYAAPITLSAGSGGRTIAIWNFSVSGAQFQYGMGIFLNRALRFLNPDCLITNHGHNHVVGAPDSMVFGEILAALETFRLVHPETPVLCLKQNPRQDSTLQDAMVRAYDEIAARRDLTLIDGHTPFVAAGKPTSLYMAGDTIHPNDAGQTLLAQAVAEVWDAAIALPAHPSPSTLAHPVQPDGNMLANGNFATWTTSPGLPDGWTAGGAGTLTVSKETGLVADNRQGYSVKLLGTGNTTLIYQDVASPSILQYVRGKKVTLAVKRYVDAAGANTVGRIALQSGSATLGTQQQSSRAFNVQQTGWVWWVVSGYDVPADATYLRAQLFHDTATSPSAYAAWFDQACLVPGLLPRSCR